MIGYGAAFSRLMEILKRLRGPDGCAWDREQTPATLRGSLVEEAYECVSAIDSGDFANLKEELGDLFMVASLISCMMEESGAFSALDVFDAVNQKLVRRHPHVFGDSAAATVKEIVSQWDRIKKEEKPGRRTSSVGRYSGFPPLERAFRIQRGASKLGFDWKHPDPVVDKLQEEIQELSEARNSGESGKVEEEIGDLLFTVINLSRLLGVDPGLALHAANEKFLLRFSRVEERLKSIGTSPQEAGLAVMDDIWNQVKSEERKASK